MRRLLLVAIALLGVLTPGAAASDPHLCGHAPAAYGCVGGDIDGDCSSRGYRYDEVLLVTLGGYVFARGDSLCYSEGGGTATYEDEQIAVGAGTDVAAAGLTWYRFRSHDEANGDYEGCRMLLRGYSAVGPLLLENMDCPAGRAPPNPGWGALLP